MALNIDAVEFYRTSLQQLEQTGAQWRNLDSRWNIARVACFVAAVVAFLLSRTSPELAGLVYVGLVLVAAFLVIITLHQRLTDKLAELDHQTQIQSRLLARCQRDWEKLPQWQPPKSFFRDDSTAASSREVISDDLDVFGNRSLFQFISMASTGPGLRTLASWLIDPANDGESPRRSAAIEALAPRRDFRGKLYLLARRAEHGTADPDHFLDWIKQPSWLDRHRALSLWSIISPLLIVAGLALRLLATDPTLAKYGLGLAALALLANAIISALMLSDVHQIFAAAIAGRSDVDGYRELFQMAGELPTGTELLDEISSALSHDATGAATAMSKLGRIAAGTLIKQVALLFPIYLLLQLFCLWEVHLLRWLEEWQDQHRSHAGDWFDALGKLEAIGSLAALADENPSWAIPHWLPASDSTIMATALGHPLLRNEHRVCNDVGIGPSGTLLLVTGSNMSGKSTMLRSVGLNVLLARAGSRVCASSLRLPPLELATSIRVRDNLGEGVSFYMAELKSLARVVKHAEQLRQQKRSAVLLFLLDEILQGTNSRERQIAVAHVLKHLIDCHAIGAVTTHDLELADDAQLKAIAHTVHFRETITPGADGQDVMVFDYQMHEGVSPTTNALRLLELVGLGKP